MTLVLGSLGLFAVFVGAMIDCGTLRRIERHST